MEQIIKGTIYVEDLKLFLNKGLYQSESLSQNFFLVSANVSYNPNQLSQGEYLDYSALANILRTCMVSDKQLLESIAHDCITAICEKWSFVESAVVKIKKIHPDFNGLNLGAVAVQLSWKK